MPENENQEHTSLEFNQSTPNIPDKFKDSEGNLDHNKLLNSYLNLEKTLSSKGNAPKEQQDTTKAYDFQDPDRNARYLQEYITNNGQLSEASYKELSHYPKNVIDSMAASWARDREASDKAILDSIGGKEVFENMNKWAVENLTSEEIAAYNKQIELGGDIAKLAVQGMAARFTSLESQPPKTRLTGTELSSKGDVYVDKQDMIRDMMKPEYRTSVAFQQQVREKLARSKNLLS